MSVARKNRRDGATVSSRVMRMSDLVGRRLFEDATAGPTPADEVDFSVQQVRRKAIAPTAKL